MPEHPKNKKVRSTVEYGGSFIIKSNEFKEREGSLRDKAEARVLKEAAGGPILREWERPDGERCLWLGPILRVTDDFYIFASGQSEQRMRKDHPDAHIEPCTRCSDWKGDAS